MTIHNTGEQIYFHHSPNNQNLNFVCHLLFTHFGSTSTFGLEIIERRDVLNVAKICPFSLSWTSHWSFTHNQPPFLKLLGEGKQVEIHDCFLNVLYIRAEDIVQSFSNLDFLSSQCLRLVLPK
jgi:hypothetical protein